MAFVDLESPQASWGTPFLPQWACVLCPSPEPPCQPCRSLHIAARPPGAHRAHEFNETNRGSVWKPWVGLRNDKGPLGREPLEKDVVPTCVCRYWLCCSLTNGHRTPHAFCPHSPGGRVAVSEIQVWQGCGCLWPQGAGGPCLLQPPRHHGWPCSLFLCPQSQQPAPPERAGCSLATLPWHTPAHGADAVETVW